MKNLDLNSMEQLQGGFAVPHLFTLNGQKVTVMFNCQNFPHGGPNGFIINKTGLGGGNAASVLHLSGQLGTITGYLVGNALFFLDCRDNGNPSVFVFIF